jgi:hypothetical protein
VGKGVGCFAHKVPGRQGVEQVDVEGFAVHEAEQFLTAPAGCFASYLVASCSVSVAAFTFIGEPLLMLLLLVTGETSH